jgi:hypothetical protein
MSEFNSVKALVFTLLFALCSMCSWRVAGEDDPFKPRPLAADDVDNEKPTATAKKNSEPAQKTELKPNAEPPAPKPVEKLAPKGPCPTCLGTGYVPISGLAAYVRAEGDAAKPDAAVPWKQCPKCQLGRDSKDLLNIESSRTAFGQKKPTEDKTGLKFHAVETRHVTLYGQDSPSELKDVAEHLEKLTSMLESATSSTLLTPCRPDTDSIYFLKDKGAYDAMLSKALGQKNDSLAFKTGGTTGQHLCTSWPKAPPKATPTPVVDRGVFNFASMLMQNATDTKCPPWLREGFASYCENAVLNQNLCYSIAYELNEVKFEKNWNSQLKKFAEDKKLRPWSEMFSIDMISLGPLQYLTCYSMVSFLIKTDPKAFVKVVAMIRDGEGSAQAIEKAYGRKVDALQSAWGSWCLTQK